MATLADGQNNDVGVKDETGLEMIEAQKEALVKEIEMFEKNLDDVTKLEARFASQWERDDKIWQIRLGAYRKKPEHRVYEYEDSEEYWDLLKGVIDDQYFQDKFTTEQKLAHYVMQKEDINTEMESCKKKLAELEAD